MKQLSHVIIMAIMVFLCIGYVNATGISMEHNVTAVIAEKELQLAKSPLIINDTQDTTKSVSGFYVSDASTGTGSFSSQTNSGTAQLTGSSQITNYPPNLVPKGGFIEYGSDGKTRVFSPEGAELSYSMDNQVERIATPSGKVLPANHIIGIPNGATIHPRGNNDYITAQGEVILTIVGVTSEPGAPLTKGNSWVEYAESDPQSNLVNFSSLWIVPHSPDIATPNGSQLQAIYSNFVWNGVEPSDGSAILQPVTAFDYYEHSSFTDNSNRTDPFIVNNWTGASWFVGPGDVGFHSTPVIPFAEGDVAQGSVYRIPSVSTWIVDLENANTGQSSGLSVEYSNPPYQSVVVYEWQPTLGSGDQSPRSSSEELDNTTFSDISAIDSSNLPITLNWNPYINQADHTATTGLNVNLAQLPSTITLCTHCGTQSTSYTITPSAGTGGNITPASPVQVLAGASQTFTITPAAGYSIANVVVNGVSQGAVSTYTFTNVQQDSTINATFFRYGWNWSTDGWGDWQHTASWSGTQTGTNAEYGPTLVNNPNGGVYGEHGTITNLSAGSTQSSVWRTFIDPSGTGWNTITFNGLLQATDTLWGRWMTINVNGNQVFGGTAAQTPPGHGVPFTITETFPQSSTVTVTIANGQNPAWRPFFYMDYYSVTLSNENASMRNAITASASTEKTTFRIPDGSEWKGNTTSSNISVSK